MVESVGYGGICWLWWNLLAMVESVGYGGICWLWWNLLAMVESVGYGGICWLWWNLLAMVESVGYGVFFLASFACSTNSVSPYSHYTGSISFLLLKVLHVLPSVIVVGGCGYAIALFL